MIGAIEQGMIDKLEAVSNTATLGYEFTGIESYSGQLDGHLREIIKSFPAVWIAFAGSKVIKQYVGSTKRKAIFKAFVGAKSLRNEKASRHGANGKAGSYQMFQDVIAVLSGETFDLEISPLEAGDITPLLNNRSDKDLASVYAVDFSTTYTSDVSIPDDSDLDDFQTFHSNWDVPAHGNVGPVLPDDDNADATDTVTLET